MKNEQNEHEANIATRALGKILRLTQEIGTLEAVTLKNKLLNILDGNTLVVKLHKISKLEQLKKQYKNIPCPKQPIDNHRVEMIVNGFNTIIEYISSFNDVKNTEPIEVITNETSETIKHIEEKEVEVVEEEKVIETVTKTKVKATPTAVRRRGRKPNSKSKASIKKDTTKLLENKAQSEVCMIEGENIDPLNHKLDKE